MNSLKESYKNLIKNEIGRAQAMAGASEDLFIEDYMRKNQGAGREQALRAYKEKMQAPVKGLNPNSWEAKFGPENSNSYQNKWG